MLRALAPFPLLLTAALSQTNFPPPPEPVTNPSTREKALLGMALFFEEQMSSTGTVACATCHDLRHGGVDPRVGTAAHPGPDATIGTDDDVHGSPGVARYAGGAMLGHGGHGFEPQVTRRRAPSVINSGYHSLLAYDGRHQNLEALVMEPPVNGVEMGFFGRTWTDVEAAITAASPLLLASDLPPRLSHFVAGRTYPELFEIAFGSPGVNRFRISKAIACYLRTLNSDRSRWDLHLKGMVQLTPQEQWGLTLFTTPANNATSCHTCHSEFEPGVQTSGPSVGQITMVPSGYYGAQVPTVLLFHNIGVRPHSEDGGRFEVTNQSPDRGRFRVPSLRNVELAAPYFHNGRAGTLRDVIDFYNRGGDFHANQAPSLTPRGYVPMEKDAIIALLKTLTDPRVAAGEYPFDAPTLGSQNGNMPSYHGRGMETWSGERLAIHAPFAPRLGAQDFRILLSGATPGIFTFLLWDTGPSHGHMPLGISLAGSPAFVSYPMGVAGTLPSMPGNGVVEAAMPLPNDPGLRHMTLFGQWLTLEPSLTWPVSTSNAVRLQLL